MSFCTIFTIRCLIAIAIAVDAGDVFSTALSLYSLQNTLNQEDPRHQDEDGQSRQAQLVSLT